jgi:hypothetical protein
MAGGVDRPEARMRTLLLSASLLMGVAGGLGACAHIDRERAEYHERKAERAARHGHYYKAAREERKADRAREDAYYDPLP